jgi:DNA-binding LacI/PurR family transcriptional regulator
VGTVPGTVPEISGKSLKNIIFTACMEKQTTIMDIALALRISKSTVSRALRDAPDIKPETKNAVKALAEELDYHPNKLALSLLNRQTHTIGVIIPNLDYVLSTMVRGIDEVALEAGYTVMVCQSDESFGREIVNTKRLLDSSVDGFIVSVSSETKVFEHIKKIHSKKIPLVLFDRVIDSIATPKVRLDNVAGGVLATQHLVDQGYKKIAILVGPQNLSISNKRMEGYLQVLKQSGIRPDKKLIIHCDFNQQYAYEATKELLAMKHRPDAIFTISDRMAIGAMLAIKEKGLQMPHDIGLVGFNNEPITSLLSPSISSVEMYSFEMGKATAKLFIEMMHGDAAMLQQEIVIKPKLFIRESSSRIVVKKQGRAN